MSYRDVDIGNSRSIDPYLPIENEPMGRAYDSANFDSIDGVKIYPYNPLTYKTNSTSYMDSWIPLDNADSVNEYFKNQKMNTRREGTFCNNQIKEKQPKLSLPIDQYVTPHDQFYIIMFIVFIFIVVIIFAYMQNKQADNLQKIIEILIKSELAKLPMQQPAQH